MEYKMTQDGRSSRPGHVSNLPYPCNQPITLRNRKSHTNPRQAMGTAARTSNIGIDKFAASENSHKPDKKKPRNAQRSSNPTLRNHETRALTRP